MPATSPAAPALPRYTRGCWLPSSAHVWKAQPCMQGTRVLPMLTASDHLFKEARGRLGLPPSGLDVALGTEGQIVGH